MLHTQVALARPVTTIMAALALLAVGLISGKLLRLEAMPDISLSGDRIAIVDIETRRLIMTIPCPGFPIRIASVHFQGRMLVSCSRSHEIVAFDVATRQEVGRKTLDLSQQPGWSERSGANTFGSTPVPMRIAVAGDGKLAYVAADLAKAVVEIDARTLEIRRILAAGGRPGGLALSTLTCPPVQSN